MMKQLLLLALFACVTFAAVDFSENENELVKVLKRYKTHRNSVNLVDEIQETGHLHHHGHGHHPPPPFLRHISWAARREFYRIVQNYSISRKEKLKQLDVWAKKQGDDILEELHKYEKNVDKIFEGLNKKIVATIPKLEDAYKKVHEIISNDDITGKEMWQKLKALKLGKDVGRSLRAIAFVLAHDKHPKGEGVEENEILRGVLGGLGAGMGFGPIAEPEE